MIRRAAFWLVVVARIVGAWGLHWDIQWHVQIGRDSFWIAPHVMMYASVALTFVVAFAVLARDTLARPAAGAPAWRVLGLVGTPGFHLLAWGTAVVVLAAPIDDLWHRLFGLDVTLWSPPHLLGLGGSAVSTLGGVLIARELYSMTSVAGLAGALLAGALLYGGVRITLDPAFLLAFAHGGVLFHAYAILAAIVLPPVLIVTARLAERRWAPVAVVGVALAVGAAGDAVAWLGFAIVQPRSVIQEEIRKDPTSPIAQANAITEKNRGTRPWSGRLVAILAAAAMALVDVRRRPVAATLAFAVALFALTGWYLAGRPAYEPLVPGLPDTLIALALTLVAGVLGAISGRTLADRLERRPAAMPAGAPLTSPVA
ncbi:MAG: hypothetical protein HYR51_16205 [Candidatus Rokubacteria bacterium]|nr:hypothetical protein [Candidatus Rokubacteria bacterium]